MMKIILESGLAKFLTEIQIDFKCTNLGLHYSNVTFASARSTLQLSNHWRCTLRFSGRTLTFEYVAATHSYEKPSLTMILGILLRQSFSVEGLTYDEWLAKNWPSTDTSHMRATYKRASSQQKRLKAFLSDYYEYLKEHVYQSTSPASIKTL